MFAKSDTEFCKCPLYIVDRSHAVNFLVGALDIALVGEGYGLKKCSSYIHIVVWTTRSKISASCEENNDQSRPSVPTNFFNDCSLLLTQFCNLEQNFVTSLHLANRCSMVSAFFLQKVNRLSVLWAILYIIVFVVRNLLRILYWNHLILVSIFNRNGIKQKIFHSPLKGSQLDAFCP